MDAEGICQELMLQDVGAAADLLLETYRTSGGRDGYASLEVSPHLARDAKGTLQAALGLWRRLNRPNIMIKIPGTAEGLSAVREALEAGVNVNITLLFSLEVYEKVVEQYLSALEARLARGQDISTLASVASFFVSRVDAVCEKTFAELLRSGKANPADRESFFGKVGVANAKLTYGSFQKLFSSPRFLKLRERGAGVQRPLWASTGTKNPSLNPLLYVEELAGPNTVNTVPPATLAILMAKGKVKPCLTHGLAEARETILRLSALGLNFDGLMAQLQDEGVELFRASYDELILAVKSKCQILR